MKYIKPAPIEKFLARHRERFLFDLGDKVGKVLLPNEVEALKE